MTTTARPTRARALTVVAAVAAAVAGWIVFAPVAGIDLVVTVGDGRQQVGVGSVVLATLVTGLVGWALRALLDRWTSRSRTVWTVLAAVVLALSLLLGPVASGVGGATIAALVVLHLLAGGVLLVGLRRDAGLAAAPLGQSETPGA